MNVKLLDFAEAKIISLHDYKITFFHIIIVYLKFQALMSIFLEKLFSGANSFE